jgi:hypothetical protein
MCKRYNLNSPIPYLNIWHGEDENGVHFCNHFIDKWYTANMEQDIDEVSPDLFNSDNY